MISDLLSKHKINIIRISILLTGLAFFVSCANVASPSGGDYDFDPPKVLKTIPIQNSHDVKKGRVEILFDELVQVQKTMEKVIIAPPQKNYPLIQAQNNKIVVELKDTLLPNTTYTIDFTDAIVDNNENNPLENYAVSFSTGNVIDTLSISGVVLNAKNLEPVSGIYVGIHSDLSDTAFTKKPFLRISRTNDYGKFSIKGIAPGKYKIYALEDKNRDYTYDNPAEAIAFSDSIIVPSVTSAVRYDSIFNIKTLAFDSLKEVNYTKFLPDDIILRSFTSSFKRQYLQKHERLTDDVLTIYFGSPTAMPEINALNISEPISDWTVLERSEGNDTLKYWITDPLISAIDTLALSITYNKTDSLNRLEPTTDTLTFVNRNKGKKIEENLKQDKKKKKNAEKSIEFLKIQTNLNREFDVYQNIELDFSSPIIDLDKEKIHLTHIVDSLPQIQDFNLEKDSLNPRKYRLISKWEQKEDYKLLIDSASLHTSDHLWNDKYEMKFNIKGADKYGTLYLNIQGLDDSIPAFVELLDKSDNPVFKVNVIKGSANFSYINPGSYYARITLDTNNNGSWDTGKYSVKREPEMVYYINKVFEIKAYWDLEEDWGINSLPLDKQKPLEIIKNKPKDENKRRKEMEKRDAGRKRQQSENSAINRNPGSRNMN